MTHALDVVGLQRQAGENLPFFLTWQDPTACSSPGRASSTASARRCGRSATTSGATGDTGFAPPASTPPSSARWRGSRGAGRPIRCTCCRSATPGDNEFITGHLAGDDFWAYAGVEQAVDMARRLGHGADAARWSGDLADFRRVLQAQARRRRPRARRLHPPSLDAGGGQDWGNYWAGLTRSGRSRPPIRW